MYACPCYYRYLSIAFIIPYIVIRAHWTRVSFTGPNQSGICMTWSRYIRPRLGLTTTVPIPKYDHHRDLIHDQLHPGNGHHTDPDGDDNLNPMTRPTSMANDPVRVHSVAARQ